MTFLYLVIGVLLHRISPILASHSLDCNLFDYYASQDGQGNLDRTLHGVANVFYERSDLAIYTYEFTEFVNFLIYDFEINFKGISVKPNGTSNELLLSLKTDLEGVGFLSNTTLAPLSKCEIDLEKNIKYRKDIPLNLQELILTLVTSCIQPKLCNQLGNPRQDDFLQAEIAPHEFDDNSAMCEALSAKYPNLYSEKKNKNDTMQSTINAFADFWIASAFSQLSEKNPGYVDLPNLNQTMDGIPLINKGYFKIFNGTFGNLRSIKRSEDVVLTNKGVHFSAVGGFHLPEARFHFDKIALKYGVMSTDGKLDINIDGIKFNIRIDMNYNTNPCKAEVVRLNSTFGEVSFKLSESNVLESIINDAISGLINQFTRNLVNFIETKLRELINVPLNRFDCEHYRP